MFTNDYQVVAQVRNIWRLRHGEICILVINLLAKKSSSWAMSMKVSLSQRFVMNLKDAMSTPKTNVANVLQGFIVAGAVLPMPIISPEELMMFTRLVASYKESALKAR